MAPGSSSDRPAGFQCPAFPSSSYTSSSPCIMCKSTAISYLLLIFATLIVNPVLASHHPHRHSRSESGDPLLVRTNKGLVRGITQFTPTGKQVDAFLGIPFAMPPIGKYRFRHPKPIESWQGVYNASKSPNSCFQVSDTFFGSNFRGSQMWNPNTPLSEDCLYLNLWVPRPRSRKMPVMVWIFGGGFYSGSISLDLYDGRILASEEKLIVASINFRSASMGFLFLDHTDAPGNAGMFDQLMALEWIRDNIAAFGGDPNLITLFGESSGAVSISYHLLSPLSRNLFTRGIMQSGGMTCPWGLLDQKEAINRTLRLAKTVGCPHTQSEADQVLECLRKIDPIHLVYNESGRPGVIDFPFVPVVDGSFLDETPQDSMKTKNFKKTQIMTGSDLDEAYYFIIYHITDLFKKEEEVFISPDDFVKIVREEHRGIHKIGQDAILHEYTPWHDLTNAAEYRNAVDKMVGDYQFTCPAVEAAYRYAASGNEVYMYYFMHRSSYSPWPKWMGVIHGDEINFVFGEPLNDSLGYRREEVELSRRMMRYWANFARTGSPNNSTYAPDQRYQETWPQHTESNREYLTLATNDSSVGRGIRLRQCAFWQQYLPALLRDVSHTKEPQACATGEEEISMTGLHVTLLLLLIGIVTLLLLMSFYAFKWKRSARPVTSAAADDIGDGG